MNEIIQMAEKLGRAIADSKQAADLRGAREKLGAEPETSKALKAFQQQSDKIRQLADDKKAIEVEDKHKLESLREKLLASEAFKALTAAQVEYVDMMRRVSEAIGRQLPETEEPS